MIHLHDYVMLVVILVLVYHYIRARKFGLEMVSMASRKHSEWGHLKWQIRYLMSHSKRLPNGCMMVPKQVLCKDLQWDVLAQYWDENPNE